jgi:tripartite-type tricarboxylate transporter receptor subunit TctC
MRPTKHWLRAIFIPVTLFAAPAGPVWAQYPVKSIRLVVPVAPGGSGDAFGRIIAPPLAEVFGRQVVVDNRSGAGANIGAEIAAKSPADGYTLLVGIAAHAINVSLYRALNYDFARDFAPVSLLASTPNILVVNPTVPAKSVKELIALAKARPGQLDYVSGGNGTSPHLAAALFISMAGVKMNHIPYKGGGPSMIALIGGEASVGFPTAPTVIHLLPPGKLRGLAVSGAGRSPSTPDLPTISEAGLKGYESANWLGLLAPTGTPREIISRLYAESVKALVRLDVKERLTATGLEPIGTTPEQFTAYIRTEIEKWRKVVRESGARVE